MSSPQLTNPKQICENLLMKVIERNQAEHLSPRENAVAERMLG